MKEFECGNEFVSNKKNEILFGRNTCFIIVIQIKIIISCLFMYIYCDNHIVMSCDSNTAIN